MSIQKTKSIVLSTMPYRESSILTTLFSSDYGRLQGIAKGIRSPGKRAVPLERGMCIEHVVYIKATREIQTLTDIQIDNFYPEIRNSIEKTAVRDTAFELILAAVKAGDHGTDLFSLLEAFLLTLCSTRNTTSLLLHKLWTFHFDFAAIMGFEHNFGSCVVCHSPTLEQRGGGYLVHDKGGICCPTCGQSRLHIDFFIPQDLLSKNQIDHKKTDTLQTISATEWIRLIRLASTYCRIHLDFKYALKSLEFLEQVFV